MNIRRSFHSLALGSILLVAAATRAQIPPAAIGLYSDINCISSDLTVEIGAMATFFVAYSGLQGFEGAEFRIDGLPAGWPVIAVTPNPAAAVVIGDPMGSGTNIGFAEAYSETACVNLFTIQVQAATAVADHVLTVTQRQPPGNQNFQCPRATGNCGPPCTWQICVVGGQLVINPTVPVSLGTWLQVKSLYR